MSQRSCLSPRLGAPRAMLPALTSSMSPDGAPAPGLFKEQGGCFCVNNQIIAFASAQLCSQVHPEMAWPCRSSSGLEAHGLCPQMFKGRLYNMA